MIDLHCHILPGLDDGAKTYDEAVEMARIAVADGITEIVATPHTQNGLYINRADVILAAVKQFQTILNDRKIQLLLYPGSEVHIYENILEDIRSFRTLTLCNADRYVLLELPVLNIPIFTEMLFSQLRAMRITPIIAHPERNVVIQNNPDLLRKWILEYGVVTQLTADSIVGVMGSRLQKTAIQMVKHQFVHVIASDAHSLARRRPVLQAAYQRLHTFVPELVPLFQNNARAILLGNDCNLLQPIPIKKKNWLFSYA
jgi:protein-tyrosine phosphatase